MAKQLTKGPGKRGQIVADTLLPIQMFPRLPARATIVADTNFVSWTQKMFLILFRNILCPQQMFPSLRSPRNIIFCFFFSDRMQFYLHEHEQLHYKCVPNKCFPVCAAQETSQATMCPQQRVPVCQGLKQLTRSRFHQLLIQTCLL